MAKLGGKIKLDMFLIGLEKAYIIRACKASDNEPFLAYFPMFEENLMIHPYVTHSYIQVKKI